MRTNDSVSVIPSCHEQAWASLIKEPDQRYLTIKAFASLIQTAANNFGEVGQEELENIAWMAMMISWLHKQDGLERRFEH